MNRPNNHYNRKGRPFSVIRSNPSLNYRTLGLTLNLEVKWVLYRDSQEGGGHGNRQ